MGNGYSYICKKCGHEYKVFPGIGMLYPLEYEKLLGDIASGKYGTERRNVLRDNPYAAVNAADVLYICSKCDFWEIGKDLTIYVPDDPDKLAKKNSGDETVGEPGRVPYVMEWDLEEDYRVLKRYYRKCPGCGGRMHKAGSRDMSDLPCPNCGERNEHRSVILWD